MLSKKHVLDVLEREKLDIIAQAELEIETYEDIESYLIGTSMNSVSGDMCRIIGEWDRVTNIITHINNIKNV